MLPTTTLIPNQVILKKLAYLASSFIEETLLTVSFLGTSSLAVSFLVAGFLAVSFLGTSSLAVSFLATGFLAESFLRTSSLVVGFLETTLPSGKLTSSKLCSG